jgi:hypothetical protein
MPSRDHVPKGSLIADEHDARMARKKNAPLLAVSAGPISP